MPAIIRLVNLATGKATAVDGDYLLDYDPLGGLGSVTTTACRARARRFPDVEQALAFYRQAHGVRADGKPNRPLTAFTVEIETVP